MIDRPTLRGAPTASPLSAMTPTSPAPTPWRTAIVLLALAVLFVPVAPATAQQPTPEQIQEFLQRHREAAQPGPEHERFARMTGTWDLAVTMWPEPSADPTEISGTMEASTILGNRFLVLEADITDFGPEGGQVTIIGFDRRSDDYTILGMDTSGTYWVTAKGPADAGGNRAVLAGEDYDAIFDGTQLYDFVLSWPDDDTFVIEIIFKDEVHTRGGPPFKMVESVARRQR